MVKVAAFLQIRNTRMANNKDFLRGTADHRNLRCVLNVVTKRHTRLEGETSDLHTPDHQRHATMKNVWKNLIIINPSKQLKRQSCQVHRRVCNAFCDSNLSQWTWQCLDISAASSIVYERRNFRVQGK